MPSQTSVYALQDLYKHKYTNNNINKMSALKLDPQEVNAPKYLKKYYHGYTPELYKEIFDLWKKCRRIDIKRWTALDYAKRAQEKSLEELKEKEFDKYRDYTFIKVEDGWQKNTNSK